MARTSNYLIILSLVLSVFMIAFAGCISTQNNTPSKTKIATPTTISYIEVIPICEDHVICYHIASSNTLSCIATADVVDGALWTKYCK